MKQTVHKASDKELVLIGGGHSHALALKMLGMEPMGHARITLISNVTHTPYSGMLPGFIAGQYAYEEAHIDLRRLTEFAGVRFILAKTIGLDLEHKNVMLEDRPSLDFDLLSLNIGSTPAMDVVPGAAQHAIPIKPVPTFLKAWNNILKSNVPQNILIVGGGAGGAELAMSMEKRLGDRATIHMINRAPEILQTHTPKVRTLVTQLCREQGIQLHLGDPVEKVSKEQLHFASGKKLKGDVIFWVTNASPAPWVQRAGLAVDAAGFMQIKKTLQSTSHDFVFAAGDIAGIEDMPRPKSGVYAVRQAKPLLTNLRAYCAGNPLVPYHPQKRALALIGTGSSSAVASKGRLAYLAPMMLKIKDHIDQKFMRKFSELPAMKNRPDRHAHQAPMRCLGCAAKVGAPILSQALNRIRNEHKSLPKDKSVLVGLNQPDDASIIKIPPGTVLVQSKDYFPSLLSDPFLLGQIITQHSFNDIFAMGADPHSALALVQVPLGSSKMMISDIYQCLSGAAQAMEAMGAVLLGGHTAESEMPGMGLTCNGFLAKDRPLRKHGLKAGNLLMLTKPIGTGTLFAAQMQRKAKGFWLDEAIDSMLQSNQAASAIFKKYKATACTDITGFGLLGHLLEMLPASNRQATLELDVIPTLNGAIETTHSGILSTLDPENRAKEDAIDSNGKTMHPAYPLLFDPQTSGGLLAGIPATQGAACLDALNQSGYTQASIIGRISTCSPSEKKLVLI